MDQPFVLCGLGRIGWRVLGYLQAAHFPVVVIDTECRAGDARLGGARLVRGDCQRPESLREAGVERARGVLILTSDDLVNITTALEVRRLHAGLRVVIRMVNQSLVARLGKAVANVHALSTASLTGPLLALTALNGQALGAFRLEGVEGAHLQVAEVTIPHHSPLRGQTVGAVATSHKTVVLAHLAHRGTRHLLRDVDPEASLASHDHLVVCGQPGDLGPLLTGTGEDAAPHVLWAGWVRRNGRVLWRTFREVDLPVKICTAVLLGVIVTSTLVLHLGVQRYSPAHAFFRTVSIMATGGDMHEQDLKESAGLEVFTASLRIVGAALLAAFTAIMANYLLRAQLGGALEVRRLPEGGHVVVCGLGSIGFRVVEELLGMGERVVVIERAGDNPLITTVRRLGAPVLLGDATVREVLRQAHSPSARSVVAATTNDLANLEIGLLARELKPKQRIVLCLTDADLAQSLREAANIRLSLSVPALAAPAFVAALFGDRVQSVFLVDGQLLAAVDLLVQPHDTCLGGQTVRAVAVDYRMVPVAALAPEGTLHPEPLQARLDAGWRLFAILALSDLEHLFRRQPAPRDWCVDVTSFPLPARSWVLQLLRMHRTLSPDDDEQCLNQLPCPLATGLSRGQAEDLLALLRRERVGGVVRQQQSAAAPA